MVLSRSVRRLVSAVLVAACFGEVRGIAAVSDAEHIVTISGFKYQPEMLTVKAGETVIWKNADIVPHTVTAVDKSFQSGSIAPGKSWRFVPTKAGIFAYTCTPHPNMKGSLVVH